jgi:hypothetical protein
MRAPPWKANGLDHPRATMSIAPPAWMMPTRAPKGRRIKNLDGGHSVPALPLLFDMPRSPLARMRAHGPAITVILGLVPRTQASAHAQRRERADGWILGLKPRMTSRGGTRRTWTAYCPLSAFQTVARCRRASAPRTSAGHGCTARSTASPPCRAAAHSSPPASVAVPTARCRDTRSSP